MAGAVFVQAVISTTKPFTFAEGKGVSVMLLVHLQINSQNYYPPILSTLPESVSHFYF